MSKKFTVKDFILYSSPCPGCAKASSIRVGISYNTKDNYVVDSSLSPVVNKLFLVIDLKISYNNALHLSIDHKTNKFSTNNAILLKQYLETHDIYLLSECDTCGARFQTHNLNFNIDKGFILATSIKFEQYTLSKGDDTYFLTSDFDNKTTKVFAYHNLKSLNLSSTVLSLPLLPKYKFKDYELLITKIKTYLLFS